MPHDTPIKPMTIASARVLGLGLGGVELVCQGCNRSALHAFDDLRLAEGTPIPAIATARRFVCSECGGRSIISLPNWSAYHPPGAGMGG